MDMNNVLLIMQAEQLGVKTCTANFDYDKALVAGAQGQPKTLNKVLAHIEDENDYADGKGMRSLGSKPLRSKVNSNATSQDYLYKTLVTVAPGDMVAVEARGQIRLAQVTDVHDEVDLSYQGPLSWVVANLTSSLDVVKAHRAAERAALNKLSRGGTGSTQQTVARQGDVRSARVHGRPKIGRLQTCGVDAERHGQRRFGGIK